MIISATDQDNGKAGEVLYSVEDSTNSFNISHDTGQLVTLKSLDREERSSYSINVWARANAPSPFFLKTKKAIIVQVGDKNDNVPKFEDEVSKYSVDETLPIGSVAVTVKVSDLDSGSNAAIVYAVVGTNDSANHLQIEQNNGSFIVKCKWR